MKNIIVGAGSSAAEIECWIDPTGSGQWDLACPRAKGIGGFFPSSAEQECTIRIDAATGITMHCSAVQEISGWTKGAGGAAGPPAAGGGSTPSAPAPAPAPTETTEEPAAEGGGESESNYGRRVNRSYRSRVRYY